MASMKFSTRFAKAVNDEAAFVEQMATELDNVAHFAEVVQP